MMYMMNLYGMRNEIIGVSTSYFWVGGCNTVRRSWKELGCMHA